MTTKKEKATIHKLFDGREITTRISPDGEIQRWYGDGSFAKWETNGIFTYYDRETMKSYYPNHPEYKEEAND